MSWTRFFLSDYVHLVKSGGRVNFCQGVFFWTDFCHSVPGAHYIPEVRVRGGKFSVTDYKYLTWGEGEGVASFLRGVSPFHSLLVHTTHTEVLKAR